MPQIRCLMLTDIVDSTALTARLGDRDAAALSAELDRVARDLLRQWRGREIDKTDGMLMLFDSVTDAVACALAYHRALAALPTPVQARIGIHQGPVMLRANAPEDVALGAKPLEVEGLAKPVAARIMSLAIGGQTLLSADARLALDAGDYRVLSHGHWRVKGMSEPLELVEVGHHDAPFQPPPDTDKVYRVILTGGHWQPRRTVPHNLPSDRDAFVGRQDAQADLARRFEQGARLVSILGIGGTGKTRLATRYGWRWLGDYPGGVWFCDLSAARDLDGILQIVARTLDVPLGAAEPVAQLGAALAARGPCLLILDSFEHLARHAQASLGRWLDSAPAAHCLVTTREVLGVAGEQALVLPPLPDEDAVALFLRRAAPGQAEDRVSADERATVERLVKLLDGLPLAIELAAARSRVMSPATMLTRMHERFKLLAAPGARRDRQSTLRATFDWSWELLQDVERAALAQLAVFTGGFTLEAAEAVLDLAACGEDFWPVDVVQSLVDKSFVHVARADRFDLLTSVQAYAADHLAGDGRFPGSGDRATQRAEARHYAWFAALGAQPAVDGAELPNLIAACRRAVRDAAPSAAVGALRGAWSVLNRYGPFSTGLDLAADVCGMPGLEAKDAARAQSVYGWALDLLGRPAEARREYARGLELAEACGERHCMAELMTMLATLHTVDGEFDVARQEFEAALALAVELGDAAAECAALNALATLELDQGQLGAAEASFELALARAVASGNAFWQYALQGNLGMLHANAGRLDEARVCLKSAVALARQAGDRKNEGAHLCNLGMLHLVLGQPEEAIGCSALALKLAQELGHRLTEGVVRCNLGLALLETARLPEAVGHFEAALRTMRDTGERRYEGQTLGYLGRALVQLNRFDAARDCFEQGRRLLAADPLSLGILYCDLARCEWLAGAESAARGVLAEAQRIAKEADVGPSSELGQAIAGLEALLGLPGS